jgi:myo-inositol-1-phosphate synthase
VNTSSWYDFNHDGNTDQVDLNTIAKNFDKHCTKKN